LGTSVRWLASAICSAARPATISASTSSPSRDWSEGDTFTDKEGRRFRIVGIDPVRVLEAIHATWTVEPAALINDLLDADRRP
jgi:hypothetical protein